MVTRQLDHKAAQATLMIINEHRVVNHFPLSDDTNLLMKITPFIRQTGQSTFLATFNLFRRPTDFSMNIKHVLYDEMHIC